MSTLRNALLPSLAEAAQRNGGRALSLFEIGEVFGRRQGTLVDEERVGFLSAGDLSPVDWEGGKSVADFFSLKGSLEAVLDAVGVRFKLRAPQDPDPRFHPTRQAEVVLGSRVAGWLGEIHPDATAEAGLAAGTVAAELSTRLLFEVREVNLELEPVSKNPAVRRDMAILVDKAVPYARIAETLERACGPLLERHWLFENYEGKGIPEGKHSLNVALVLRKQGANLTDEEANQVRQKAEQALADLGATTR
jgi:phenylalanyl-tRNA synthetase beta chain